MGVWCLAPNARHHVLCMRENALLLNLTITVHDPLVHRNCGHSKTLRGQFQAVM